MKLFKILWASMPFVAFFIFMAWGLGIEVAIIAYVGIGAIVLWVLVAAKLWPTLPKPGPPPRDYSESSQGIYFNPVGSHETNPFDETPQ